jgi:hypothetical protein
MALPVRSRRVFGIGLWRFRVPPRLQDALLTCLTTVTDGAIYLLGPILICFALVIASGLSYTFFAILLPMLKRAWSESPYYYGVLGLHIGYVIFILINVLYNYFLCVITPNKGEAYERVVRELADATGFDYPEFPDEVKQFKRDYEDRMILRMERRRARAAASNQASNVHAAVPGGAASLDNVTQRRAGGAEASSSPAASNAPRPTLPKGGWRFMGPQEWGYCPYSNQPKPPRSHYDHVTKTLVLNMDHFCPWMFNTSTSICFPLRTCPLCCHFSHTACFQVGYFNYRYFCNFLFYVFFGMFYGALLSFRSFRAITSFQRRGSENVWAPARQDESAIAFGFMLCLSVGLAVACLGGFHLYLLLSAQTTIEFHGTCRVGDDRTDTLCVCV